MGATRWKTGDEKLVAEVLPKHWTKQAASDELSSILGWAVTPDCLLRFMKAAGMGKPCDWLGQKPHLEARLRANPGIRSPRAAVMRPPPPPPPARDTEVPPEPATLPKLPPDEEDSEEAYVPRPPRGPQSTPHYLPAGHELGGVSTLVDQDGEMTAQWAKTRVAGADLPPRAVPDTFHLKKTSLMQRADGSTVLQWSTFDQEAKDRFDAVREAVVEHVAAYVRPALPVELPQTSDADRLTVYPVGDPHVGMLAWAEEVGENFDLKIAEAELCECMSQLVSRSPPTDEAVVTNLGDFFHADSNEQRTPASGNKLDVDGRVGKVARVGLRIFRTLVDCALQKHARVRVRSIPGNHDPVSGVWLPLILKAVYEREPRVTVESGDSPFQYDRFGDVLLGWCHGDGAKFDDLGEIMAADVPELWGATKFRYWNTGHVHHLTTRELRGCVVDTHRTLAGADAWHRHSGYRSGRSLKSVVYHRRFGLDSTASVGVERVRAALCGEL